MQRQPVNLQIRYGANTLAVVAGATSDTGRAICDKLKQNGFQLVLVDSDEV